MFLRRPIVLHLEWTNINFFVKFIDLITHLSEFCLMVFLRSFSALIIFCISFKSILVEKYGQKFSNYQRCNCTVHSFWAFRIERKSSRLMPRRRRKNEKQGQHTFYSRFLFSFLYTLLRSSVPSHLFINPILLFLLWYIIWNFLNSIK